MKKNVILSIFLLIFNSISSLKAEIPLFRIFPQLKEIPYKKLGDLPSPVSYAQAAAQFLGIHRLYIKRDDLSGALEGGMRLPGCLRKLEFHLAQAQALGFSAVSTFGNVSSNHVTATALYAQRLGMSCYAHLFNHRYSDDEQAICRKLLLNLYFGAQINGAIHDRVYEIPEGGTDGRADIRGLLGFVNAAFELRDQIDAGILPEPDVIYIPLGTGGMAVALFLGLQLAGIKSKLIAVNARKSMLINDTTIVALYNRLCTFLKSYRIDVPNSIFEGGFFSICNMFASEAGYYGFIPPLFSGSRVENWATVSNKLLYDHEKIKLDREYSGKAFVALVVDASRGALSEKTVLFWNTTFNTDLFDPIVRSFLAERKYRELPEVFWPLFGYVRPTPMRDDPIYDWSSIGCG